MAAFPREIEWGQCGGAAMAGELRGCAKASCSWLLFPSISSAEQRCYHQLPCTDLHYHYLSQLQEREKIEGNREEDTEKKTWTNLSPLLPLPLDPSRHRPLPPTTSAHLRPPPPLHDFEPPCRALFLFCPALPRIHRPEPSAQPSRRRTAGPKPPARPPPPTASWRRRLSSVQHGGTTADGAAERGGGNGGGREEAGLGEE